MDNNQEIPLYELVINPKNKKGTGLTAISFVHKDDEEKTGGPANEVPFMMFSKEDIKKIKFSVSNEEQRIVTGPVIIPEKIIPRQTDLGEPYNVVFKSDKVQGIVESFFENGYNENSTYQHCLDVDGAVLFESLIYDPKRNYPPKGYENMPPQTWFVSYKITSDELWNKLKEDFSTSLGDAGFSLEGLFHQIPIEMSKSVPNLANFYNNILKKIPA